MVVLKSFPPPSEGVRLLQADTAAVLDGQRLGSGTLFVAEAHLSWFDGSGMGFSLEYPSISLHAISRDLSAFPEEHLYVMVNAKLDEGSQQAKDPNEEEESDDEESGVITEIRFVPGDKAAYPEDSDSDEDDYEGEEYNVEEAELEQAQAQAADSVPTFCTYEEGLSRLTVEGQATLERLEGMLAQSVTQQYHMAGVRTDQPLDENGDGMEVESSAVAGQFDDADVDH
ncbi:hypothetical protein DNTS_033986 [Danionella cerebrum]|uniref:Methylosome subunit pICln n=1 Tax=Danionella cerebrum TaxID=2873325 RepID=A0A553RAE4_9TELE|nr:hypothetical protein DNTS_033986 [Danionella translucida]